MIGNQQRTNVATRIRETLATLASEESLLVCSRLDIDIAVVSCNILKCSRSFLKTKK